MQAYEGYFENGQFVPIGAAQIPNRRKVILTVLDEQVQQPRETAHARAWREFFEEIEECDKPLDPKFDELLKQRVNFTREFNL